MENEIKPTIGLIPANRGFFSGKLAADLRNRTLQVMKDLGVDVVVPDESLTNLGCVESLEEAEKVGKLFRDSNLDGIVIGAMNFGDEQGVALTIKAAGLNHLPILAFGGQEVGVLTEDMDRRDSFCGLISICEVLREIGCQYTLPRKPICYPEDDGFKEDLAEFVAVCRVVSGIRNVRIGQVGTRPDPFWTCRFSERSLQQIGATVVTMDLSEIIANVRAMSSDSAEVKETVAAIMKTADKGDATDEHLAQMAKFEVALKNFIEEKKLNALAIQCWTSLQENLGVCSCTSMARLGQLGFPSACEVDVPGALSMYALRLAANQPAALADWNNLHPDDPDVVNLWHCGVYPESFAGERPVIKIHDILKGSMEPEKTVGTMQARTKTGPVTLARIAEGREGDFKLFVGEGEVIDIPGTTFGAYGWTRVPGLSNLYRDVVLQHFPHHIAFTQKQVGNVLYEAVGKYLGFKPFFNGQRTYGEFEHGRPFSNGG